MKRAFVTLVSYERAGRGLQLSNFRDLYYGYRVSNAFYMFFVTFVLCFGLGVYLTNVLRVTREDQDEGVHLPWYYPLTMRYWRG
jgi:hypothetical protein